jgi:DNA-binding Xre family transcriptional regulator
MDQTAKLLDTLKAYLKSRDITYRNLAQRWRLSESSIKRVKSEKTLSLKRLERILQSLDLDFYDLAHMSRRQDGDSAEALSLEQEESLLQNPRMLIFLHLLIKKWKVEQITKRFDFESHEITNILLELDRLRLIDLHPHNQFKVLINNTQLWNRSSPFMKKYKEMLQNGFLSHDFEEKNERFLFSPCQLSEDSHRILLKEIDRLLRRFKELSEADAGPEQPGLEQGGMVVAFRPWLFPLLESLRRKQTTS